MARRAKTHQRITGQALQREEGRDRMIKPQSYLIQTVSSEEVTIRELAEYTKDENIEVEFDNELMHIITRIY